MKNTGLKIKFWLSVALQIIILISLLFYNQLLFIGGQTVLLKLSPPRDPLSLFQGHYLRLIYEISELRESGLPQQYAHDFSQFKAGQAVYIVLMEQDGYFKAQQALSEKPKDVTFIKGTISSVYSGRMAVTYGIESYFIPEKNWQEVENKFRRLQANQDVFVEVALSRSGRALIKKILINGEEIDVSKVAEEKGPPSSGSGGRARDSRIVSAISQGRTVMTYVAANDGTHDNFTCQQQDMAMLCEEISNNNGWPVIAHDLPLNSQGACLYSPLTSRDNYWYCADSTGRAGYTSINPDSQEYCWDSSSAVCPPFD